MADSDLFSSSTPAPADATAPPANPRRGAPTATPPTDSSPGAPVRAPLPARAALNRRLLIGLGAGIAGAVVAAFLYYAIGKWRDDQVVPALLIGPVVGLAIRFAARSSDRRLAIAAAVLASLSFMGGYYRLDFAIHQTTLGESTSRMFTLAGIIIHVVAINLAYVLATRNDPAPLDDKAAR